MFLPDGFLVVFVLLVTVAVGIGWKVLEFAAHLLARGSTPESMLIQYGLKNMLVDLAGALAVTVVEIVRRTMP